MNHLKPGQWVSVHPALDLFMRGVTHAEVTKIGVKWVHLYHPASKTRHKITNTTAKWALVPADVPGGFPLGNPMN